MGDNSKVISDCKDIIKILDDTSEMEKEIEHHTTRVNEIVVLVQNLIKKCIFSDVSRISIQV